MGASDRPQRKSHGSKSRELRIIATVACPVCRAEVGEPCRLRDDERAKIHRPGLIVHTDRKVAWQMVRDGEVT